MGSDEIAVRGGQVSVIIAVRNDKQRLRRCVAAIRRWSPWAEVVIVDNDSDDDTYDVARQIGDVSARWPGTASDCRRWGAELASGSVLAFVDADQVVGPETLVDAVGVLGSADAVVIPERPLHNRGLYMRVVRSERRLSEWAGYGVPRVVRKDLYFALGGHPAGVWFGEDRLAFRDIGSVRVSRSVIYHDEVTSFVRLLGKYRRYGSGRGGGSFGAPYLRAMLRLGTLGETRLTLTDLVLVPAVVGLKACKLGALCIGRVASRRGMGE